MAHTTHNILFLNSIEKSVWGGLENWMELSAQGLAHRGHRVWVAGRAASVFLRRIGAHSDIGVIPLEIGGDFNPVTIQNIARNIREHHINVVLCNFVKDVRLAGLARKLTGGCKIVWTPGVNLAKKSLSHKWLFSGFVDRAIVPSAALKDEIIASGFIESSRIAVIPIGIDDALWRGSREEGRKFIRARYNLPDDAFVCLTSGRFVKQKGHCHLVEAARVLVRKYPNIFFLLLGDGPLQPDLLRQIKQNQLTDRFVLCGILDRHQDAVFGADLYVHPAVVEPFGIVLIEAMAASLPVVATRVGGIPEVVEEGKTAFLIEPADPGQLTNAIERFYNDPSLRASYGQAGYKRYVGCYRLETMIDRIEGALDETAVS